MGLKVAARKGAAIQPSLRRAWRGLGGVRALSASAEDAEKRFVVPTYGKGGVRSREGLVFESGQGFMMKDREGKEYVDFGAGIAVNVLGHADKDWTAAVADQVGKLAHVSNLYHTSPYLELAEKLVSNSPGMSKVFFCNSGTEATEGAIKFARVYHNAQGEGATRNRFISFKKSFHGRSLGALSLTYKPAIREPFAPMLMPRVDHLCFNCIKAVEGSIGPDVVAVVMEPVQGEGGINPASREFVQRVRELCDLHGVMLIFDEVQIGLGRHGNGRLWAYEEYGIVPDAVTMAKPLANGMPIGAVMLGETMYNKVPESAWLGTHGSTFAANPVVTRAACVVLDKLLAPGFLARVSENGKTLIHGLDELQAAMPGKITAVRRPLGDAALYAGVQLPGPYAGAVVAECLANGLVIISAGDDGSVLRLCPPLIVGEEQIRFCLDVIGKAIAKCVPESSSAADGASADAAAEEQVRVEMAPMQASFDSSEAYESEVEAQGHAVLPEGFSVGTSTLKFFPEELPRTPESTPASMALTLIVPDRPTQKYAALFTSNSFPGAPIKVGREIVKSGKPLGAIVVNNKISNVHPRGTGVQDAVTICDSVAQALGLEDGSVVLPSSTGVIGWRLPVQPMVEAIPGAVKTLQAGSAMPAAKGIMTTDSFPKSRSCVLRDANGKELGRVTGIAKGAGMVEPDMATMLVYVMTDIDAEAAVLDRALRKAVNADGSFNCISVDSDQSTSDTIVLLSSGAKPRLPAAVEEAALTQALSEVCSKLAQDVVRNGEGTQHVIRCEVSGAPSAEMAKGVAKSVINSPLVKTAVAGNDANVGRLIMAIGKYVGKHNPAWNPIVAQRCEIHVGGLVVFKDGEFCIDDVKEVQLQDYLKAAELPAGAHYPTHDAQVDIRIFLQGSEAPRRHSSVVFGSDFTHTYVDVNAGYRS